MSIGTLLSDLTNTSPIVSVVIPVYNYEKYIAAAIESVLLQSFTDWELIIVDDHSSDRTPEIINSYADGKKIRCFRNEHNLGQFPTHNRGADLAKGRYIKFLHGDDLIYPHCLEIMVTLMEAFPEAGFGISHNPWPWIAPKLFTPAEVWQVHTSGQSSMMSQGPLHTIFKTEVFRAVGGFDIRYDSSDVKMNLTLAMKYPVLLLPEGLLWYRLHPDQILQRMKDRDIGSKEKIIWYPKLLDDSFNPLSLEQKISAKEQVLRDYARLCLYHCKNKRIRRAWSIWKASGLPLQFFFKLLGPRSDISKFEIEQPSPLNWSVYPGKPISKEATASNQIPPSRKLRKEQVDKEKYPNPQTYNNNRDRLPLTDNFSQIAPPFVSVLIPAYSAEAKIKESIQSVLSQRFDDWELIIVDDGGTDRTFEIAKGYADGNKIRCFRNNINIGKWDNHNHCAGLARGKYIKFLHAGDLLYPHCLEMMVSLMECHPDAGLGISGECGPYRAGVCLDPEMALKMEFFGTPRFLESPTALIMRKDIFMQVGGFEPIYEPSERHLQLKIADVSPTVLINKGLIHYRNYSQRTFMGQEKWRLGWAEGYKWLAEWLFEKNKSLNPSERKYAVTNLMRYAWRGGDPYLGKRNTPRKLKLNERAQILKIASRHGIPLKQFVIGPTWKTGDPQMMHAVRQHFQEINDSIPDWSVFVRKYTTN
ncbi:glycosyltransferase family 2 protein [Thermodesulfobacteriota bacterium]